MSKKNLRIIVEQKVMDDSYYVRKFIWTIVDDDNKVYTRGEEDTREKALEVARKKIGKL